MSDKKLLFSTTEHFYAEGKHRPVTAEEEKTEAQSIMRSRVSFLFMGVILSTALVYIIALIIDSIGLHVGDFMILYAACWLVLMAVVI